MNSQKFFVVSAFLTGFSICSYAATPPEQPLSGPGGQEYAYASVTKHEYGEGASRYWIYEPADPAPVSAPLVIFNHGWSAINPKSYGAWIEHIVRRGNIVVYPIYQDSLRTPTPDFLPNAFSAVRDALVVLQQNGHVHPMLDKIAVVGHSMGGIMSADMAAIAQAQGLPQPKAVMCVEPDGGNKYHLQDLSQIPAQTLFLIIVGDADRIAKDTTAKKIYQASTSLPVSNKNYIIVQSDSHGSPPLKANHLAPVAPDDQFDSGERLNRGQNDDDNPGPIRERLRMFIKARLASRQQTTPNALNYYGYWKLFDALCDAAFYGKNRDFALGNTPKQRYMGQWSDGVPVKELLVSS